MTTRLISERLLVRAARGEHLEIEDAQLPERRDKDRQIGERRDTGFASTVSTVGRN